MNLSDTFYVALCMTVLIIGVVYWFWTQNQYIQRKLNLLENIVYDMKSSMNFSGGGPPDHVEKALAAAAAASQEHHAAPSEVIAPLNDEIVDDDDVDKILSSMAVHEMSDQHARDVAGWMRGVAARG